MRKDSHLSPRRKVGIHRVGGLGREGVERARRGKPLKIGEFGSKRMAQTWLDYCPDHGSNAVQTWQAVCGIVTDFLNRQVYSGINIFQVYKWNLWLNRSALEG